MSHMICSLHQTKFKKKEGEDKIKFLLKKTPVADAEGGFRVGIAPFCWNMDKSEQMNIISFFNLIPLIS